MTRLALLLSTTAVAFACQPSRAPAPTTVDDVEKAIGIVPAIPERISLQSALQERIYVIDDPPQINQDGSMALSDVQYQKAKEIVRSIFLT